MRSFVAHTRKLAAETPATRNRIIDFWRVVAIIVVILGHWLAAGIWVQRTGDVELMNAVQLLPFSAWVTWLVQVMPIFFFVGGYANARALRRVEAGEQRPSDWITARIRRLYTPVVPLIAVWTLLVIVMRPLFSPDIVQEASRAGTVLLWFMAVYLVLVGTAPLTHRWWQRYRWGSVAALAGAALIVDVTRFAGDQPGFGWANFLFVWATIHQLGYWWAARDSSGKPVPHRVGWVVMTGALAALVAVTSVGWYPVAMVGVTGDELTNMDPPTFAMVLLGAAQAGLIWGTQGRVAALVSRARVWHAVVALSSVIMTLYLWHLSALAIVGATGLFAFDGAAFRFEPGTTAWWLTRPLWVIVLTTATALLVALFARFEWRINPTARPARTGIVVVALLLCAGAAGVTAELGLVESDASINWFIPIAAFSGALLIGAYPKRRPGHEGSVRGPGTASRLRSTV